jgi:hypothetical protein
MGQHGRAINKRRRVSRRRRHGLDQVGGEPVSDQVSRASSFDSQRIVLSGYCRPLSAPACCIRGEGVKGQMPPCSLIEVARARSGPGGSFAPSTSLGRPIPPGEDAVVDSSPRLNVPGAMRTGGGMHVALS